MARGRMLNRDVCVSLKFHALASDATRLLATWCIAHLDKHGVFYGDPMLVKAAVLPMRADLDHTFVAQALADMERTGLIVLFQAAGRTWQWWPGFAANQPNLRAERESTTFPDPPSTLSGQPAPAEPPIPSEPLSVAEQPGAPAPDQPSAPTTLAEPDIALRTQPRPRRVPRNPRRLTESDEPRLADPRVRAWVTVFGALRLPRLAEIDAICAGIPEDQVNAWTTCLQEWAAEGWRHDNVTGQIERFKRARIQQANATSKRPAPTPKGGTFRRPVVTYTPEQRKAAEERARISIAERANRKARGEVQ